MTDTRTYFLIVRAGRMVDVKRPMAEDRDAEFARELIAHYPDSQIITVRVRPDSLWAEHAKETVFVSEMWAEVAAAEKKIAEENKAFLDAIKEQHGEVWHDSIVECIKECEGIRHMCKLAFAEKPRGQKQEESYAAFKTVWVDQRSEGMEGDSFSGEVYVQLPDGKYIEIPYAM